MPADKDTIALLKEAGKRYIDILDQDYDISMLDKVLTQSLLKRNSESSFPASEIEVMEMYGQLRSYFNDKFKKSSSLSDSDSGDSIIFLKSSEIVSKPIDWLWEGKIAKGKVSLIAGHPGLGKSQLTIFLAGIVSTGGKFPSGHDCKKGSVLFFSAEDDPEDTINPRLSAVGADKEKIRIFSVVRRGGKDKFFDLSKDMDLLEKALEFEKDVALIIVDPVTAFLGDTDSHVNAEVRALLSMLSKIAASHHIAVVVVTHLNKGNSGNAMNQITGSLAFVAAARAAYMVVKDDNDESRRLFLPAKNNLARDEGGFAFKVESAVIENGIETSRIVWEKEPVTMTISEAMKQSKEGEGGVSKETVKWLEAYLEGFPDGADIDIVQKNALRNGISRATLYRAKQNSFIDNIPASGRAKKWILNKDYQESDEAEKDALSKF